MIVTKRANDPVWTNIYAYAHRSNGSGAISWFDVGTNYALYHHASSFQSNYSTIG